MVKSAGFISRTSKSKLSSAVNPPSSSTITVISSYIPASVSVGSNTISAPVPILYSSGMAANAGRFCALSFRVLLFASVASMETLSISSSSILWFGIGSISG